MDSSDSLRSSSQPFAPYRLNVSSTELRSAHINRLDGGVFDVFVVGGGINGAVSAAALADRGLQVAVVDQADFGSFTSQESSNLIWGGFKYLQNYEIPLVFKLCRSRNRLMDAYPTIIGELPFLATLDKSSPFPAWLAGAGSLAYWAIGMAATRRPRYYRAARINDAEPIIDASTTDAAIEYADGYLKENDARFVWNFVRSAINHGAVAANYVRVVGARLGMAYRPETAANDGGHVPRGAGWTIDLRDEVTGRIMRSQAKTLVNAAGPFSDRLNRELDIRTTHRIVLSKGIHLVVPQLTPNERVLAFFDDTQRLFYVIPMAHRSVIGTTDSRTSNPREPVTEEDRDFLLAQINARLNLDKPLTRADIIAERNGVRPLVVQDDGDDKLDTDWTSLSRKHEIEIDRKRGVVTIFGGKLTDCLNVGEEVVDAIASMGLEVGPDTGHWFGEPPVSERFAFYKRAAKVGLRRRPEIERADSMAEVLWRRHGTAAHQVVEHIQSEPAAAQPIMAESDILQAEIPLYLEREMVVTLDDFLRRRTKLALLHRADVLAAEPGVTAIDRTLLGVG